MRVERSSCRVCGSNIWLRYSVPWFGPMVFSMENHDRLQAGEDKCKKRNGAHDHSCTVSKKSKTASADTGFRYEPGPGFHCGDFDDCVYEKDCCCSVDCCMTAWTFMVSLGICIVIVLRSFGFRSAAAQAVSAKFGNGCIVLVAFH